MHIPVLLKETIELLDPRPGEIFFDGTLGGGGHAGEILEKLLPGGKLIAVDRDPEAVKRVPDLVAKYGKSLELVNSDFRSVERILSEVGEKKIDGALFDLGISSFQVDEAERGFSFRMDGPLDMRMDPSGGLSAEEVVNGFNRDELEEIIRNLGEERHARLAAKAICLKRKQGRIKTTLELKEVLEKGIGRWYRRQKLSPAARTFQALRIFVNDELGAVEQGVKEAIDCLAPGGRICVISFHSLEDRIVKNIFRDNKRSGGLELLTKKPLRPSSEEVEENPRSRSARLRAARRPLCG